MTTATLPRTTRASVAPERRTWRPRVKRPGAVLAAAGLLTLVMQPALLPHLWWVQAIVGGLAAAQAYALVALATRLTRPLTRRHTLMRDGARRLLEPLALPGAAAVAGAGLLTGYPGQVAVATHTGMTAAPFSTQVVALAGAVLVAVAVVGLARGLRRLARSARRHPRRAAVATAIPLFALTMTTATTATAAPAATARLAVSASGGRGGGAASAHPADLTPALGRKGAEFLAASNPTHAVRVYVGKDAAATPEERAELAVDQLERDGGLDKGTILIEVPTGSGWVDPNAVRSLEKLTGGDLATVVVQYAAHPSWLAYLKGGEGVQQSVRALVDAVDERADGRTRVLIHGESLGAWGGLRAYDQGDDILNHVDGALWTGVPGGAPTGNPRSVTLIHPDDPVPAWSPRLMVERSDQWPKPWLPVASFWQATADTLSAPTTPAGHGHKYGEEVTGGWAAVLSATPTYDSAS